MKKIILAAVGTTALLASLSDRQMCDNLPQQVHPKLR